MLLSESFAPALFEFCGLQSVCKLLQNAKKRSISQSVRLVGKYVRTKNAPLNRERFFALKNHAISKASFIISVKLF